MSDFKSNEYANLIGGKLYEPEEENPMLGFRGASRYVSDNFRDCFDLEVRALKKVRNEMGLTNVEVMIPFVRTTGEAKRVLGATGREGAEAWRQWPARYHDVRTANQCAASRRFP
jgi:pyruvate,water dikinase